MSEFIGSIMAAALIILVACVLLYLAAFSAVSGACMALPSC